MSSKDIDAVSKPLLSLPAQPPAGHQEPSRRMVKQRNIARLVSSSTFSVEDVSSAVEITTTPPMPLEELIPSSPVGNRKRAAHVCLVCHKIFHRPSSLNTHMNIHNNLRPFACGYPGCDSRFNARSNALRHRHLHGVEFVRSVEAEQRATAERDAREARGEGALFAETIVADECAPSSAGQRKTGYGNVRWMPTNQPTRNYAPYVLSSPGRRRRTGRSEKGGACKQDQTSSCVEDVPR